jgi:hypothetical protein
MERQLIDRQQMVRDTDGQTDRWTDRQMDKQTDGQTDGQTDRWTDREIDSLGRRKTYTDKRKIVRKPTVRQSDTQI